MRLSNRIFNNPDVGSYSHRKAVLVLDDSASSIPLNHTADSVVLQLNDRVLFTGLSDAAANNRVYEVENVAGVLTFILAKDGINPNGDSSEGEVVLVRQGSHASELWGYENAQWQILDVDVDTSDNLNESDIGTNPGQLVALDEDGKLPAVDGSELLNLPSSGGGGAEWQRVDYTYVDFVNQGGSNPTIVVTAIPANSIVTAMALTTSAWSNSDSDSMEVSLGSTRVGGGRDFGYNAGEAEQLPINVQGANVRIFQAGVNLKIEVELDGGSGDASDLNGGAVSVYYKIEELS